jgi:hypothetical protein
MMSHAVNKKAFSNGSKSVEDEKKRFLPTIIPKGLHLFDDVL